MNVSNANKFPMQFGKMEVVSLISTRGKNYNTFQIKQNVKMELPGSAAKTTFKDDFNFLEEETPEPTYHISDRRCLSKMPKSCITIEEAQKVLDKMMKSNDNKLYIAETFMLNPLFVTGFSDAIKANLTTLDKVVENTLKMKNKGQNIVYVEYKGKSVPLYSTKSMKKAGDEGKVDFCKCVESVSNGLKPMELELEEEEVGAASILGGDVFDEFA